MSLSEKTGRASTHIRSRQKSRHAETSFRYCVGGFDGPSFSNK